MLDKEECKCVNAIRDLLDEYEEGGRIKSIFFIITSTDEKGRTNFDRVGHGLCAELIGLLDIALDIMRDRMKNKFLPIFTSEVEKGKE